MGSPGARGQFPASKLIIAIGLGLGLAITAVALMPLSHALTGSVRPHVPLGAVGGRGLGAAQRGGHCAHARSKRSGWAAEPSIRPYAVLVP